MTILVKNKHTLQIDEFKFRCCVGKNGITKSKKEGDKKTPKGSFEIENLYFRKDRLEKPLTSLKCIPIKKSMGWCNDIRFPRKYNKLFKIEKRIKHELTSYPKRPWYMHEREKIAAWYRHAMLTDRPAIPGYFQYTPEVMLSFLGCILSNFFLISTIFISISFFENSNFLL